MYEDLPEVPVSVFGREENEYQGKTIAI